MTPTFNMRDLANAVAENFGLTRQSGAEVARFVFDRIKRELGDGKQVRLDKFGTLEARDRAASVARNPITGARVSVPARRAVKLTVSPALREFLATASSPARLPSDARPRA